MNKRDYLIELFNKNNVPYRTKGKNTQKGWINLNCPNCNDNGFHGGICYEKKEYYYNCWKCGWQPIKKLFEKLNIKDYEIKNNYEYKQEKAEGLAIPEKVIIPGSKTPESYHIKYLKQRGFDDYETLISKYNLYFTNHLSDYKFRIIFPIYFNSRIVSYQGRDITNQQTLRYKACRQSDEIINHKHLLFNLGNCNNDKIIVMEGIFDVLKFGDNSCCSFGTAFTPKQVNLLSNYQKVFILFDNDESGYKASEKLSNILESYGVETEIITLSKNKDTGELNSIEILQLKKELGFYNV